MRSRPYRAIDGIRPESARLRTDRKRISQSSQSCVCLVGGYANQGAAVRGSWGFTSGGASSFDFQIRENGNHAEANRKGSVTRREGLVV